MPGFSLSPAFAHRLVVQGLACRRGERLLFTGLGFAMEPGEALVLTGANGAGKTSLLRILAGLLKPAAGSVAILPAVDDRPLPQVSRLVATRDALKSALTVRETLAFSQALGGQESGGAETALERFRLRPLADMPCGYLSSGQRRRVALAGLIAGGAARPLWLLDEPTNALDASACALLAEAVAAHRARGGLVVAASHLALGWPSVRDVLLEAPNAAGHRAS